MRHKKTYKTFRCLNCESTCAVNKKQLEYPAAIKCPNCKIGFAWLKEIPQGR